MTCLISTEMVMIVTVGMAIAIIMIKMTTVEILGEGLASIHKNTIEIITVGERVTKD